MTVPVRSGAARPRGAAAVRPKVRGRAPATVPTGSGAPARSSAAQRAYERRTQRATGTTAAPARRGAALTARIPFVATVIGLLSVGLAITLLLTTRSAEDSYKLSAARQHNQELSEQRSSLQRDNEAAASAPELARKATELGMIPVKNVARLVVAPDGTVTVVGDPAPAQGTPAPPLNKPAPAPTPTRNLTPTTRAAAPTTAARPGSPLAANQPQLQAEGEHLIPMTTATPGAAAGQAGSAGGQR
ncbi:hypothetical protein [Rhodococcus tukisamuensis]|uniref:Cell division protein FtsL n=1 Tax=Rhodococcus tukisamuensis TaxID=168276 RepID=A0A1G7BHW4_9NOCA|nr:hypothetical protein [Rhodococcus tukisamuensis]SDE26654.1 hypothetical protein SAMN05444580_11350 [Rhodococcus tukisamuensis]